MVNSLVADEEPRKNEEETFQILKHRNPLDLARYRDEFRKAKDAVSKCSVQTRSYPDACAHLGLDPPNPVLDEKVPHFSLKPWQVTGSDFAIRQEASEIRGGIIADDCGLGKTVTLLSVVLLQKDIENWHVNYGYRPTLVIAPKQVIGVWAADMEKYFPSLQLRVMRGNSSTREGVIDTFSGSMLSSNPFEARREILRDFPPHLAYEVFHRRNLLSYRRKKKEGDPDEQGTTRRKKRRKLSPFTCSPPFWSPNTRWSLFMT
jgi:SNF2 family DNA or RNA helicase